MDTKGNIQTFPHQMDALAKGFDGRRTPAEAERLKSLPAHKRKAELVRMRHQAHLEAKFGHLTREGQRLAKLEAELRRKRNKAARRARKRNRRAR